jgi:hypothetical protein
MKKKASFRPNRWFVGEIVEPVSAKERNKRQINRLEFGLL